MRLITTALLFVFASYSASADESANQAAMDKLTRNSPCLSFYSILRECAGSDTVRVEAETAMLRVGNLMMDAAKAAHLQPSDEQLRFDLNLLDQRTFVGNSCSAVGTLQARYVDQCGKLSKADPG